MKDLAIDYIEELKHEAEKENPNKVPITLRVHPAILKRLERIAKELGKSRAEVGADVLTQGSMELAIHLAKHLANELGMTDDQAKVLIWGEGETK